MGFCRCLFGKKKTPWQVTQSLFPPFHISCEPLQAMELVGWGTCGNHKPHGRDLTQDVHQQSGIETSMLRSLIRSKEGNGFVPFFCGSFHFDIILTYFD